jgi:uncharacterized membrane protein YphA (DoxX/SURF4 family)
MISMKDIDWTHDRFGSMLPLMNGSARAGVGPQMNTSKIAFWIATGLVGVAFFGSGIANLIHAPHIAADMAHLGYPPYFLTILGMWKVLGGIAIVAPRLPHLKEWAYAGMMFDLTGAAISRAVSGDGFAGVAPPLLIAVLVVASWALRSPDRVYPRLLDVEPPPRDPLSTSAGADTTGV